MQKKLIALAIASAISAPAFADNANVTFYGKLIADVESVKSDKSTLAPFTAPATGASYTANRVVSDASRFGLKGEDDLGDGLKAIFQIETQVELIGNGTTFSSVRNTGAGLSGNLGTVMIANWDTPYKLTHNKVELFDNTTFASATNLIGRSGAVAAVGGVNTAATSDSFVTRKAGVVQYYSPKMSGFDVKVAFAPASDTYIGGVAATKQNQALLSLSGTFEMEQLYVAAGYESHSDFLTPTATRGTGANTAARIVGAYTIMNGLMVGATVERLSISQTSLASATGVDKKTRTGYELMGSYKMGTHNFGLSYAKQGDLGSAVSTGAKQISLRYGYDFSKRTQAFVMYSALSNDTAGQYALSAGQGIASAAGAKYSGFGAGLQHTF